jgi:16S rRNA (guanine1207-N2)-methyltransferase
VTLDLVTDRGVFAVEAVDAGTKLLLLEAPAPPDTDGSDVLDLGCGYGAIGGYGAIAVTLARRAPSASVWAVDVNDRARELTAENAAAAGTTNVRVSAPDDVPPEVTFDAVYSNPPIRIGKAALHDLLERWLDRLRPGGTAWLVVHKHLGSDSLARWLLDRGHPVERLTSRMGYRILAVGPRP